ncbi:MAG: polysaccharide deacetylase family protein [Elusimicrobiales bacterium]|nr:polysaccharide deacetylase family protein [Elusimicrobiales bacterium]
MKICIILFALFFSSNLNAENFYSYGDPSKNEIALTYDDGPSPDTLALCDILKKYGVKATFFVLGENVKRYPGYLKRIKEDGHLIGSHTYSHKNFYKFKNNPDMAKIIEDEIIRTENEIKKITGEKPVYLRYPYGYNAKIGIDMAKKMGYKVYNWSFGYDWNKIDDEELVNKYISNIKPGAIFLMHDRKSKTDRVLNLTQKLIEELNKRGYKTVGLDEMSFK